VVVPGEVPSWDSEGDHPLGVRQGASPTGSPSGVPQWGSPGGITHVLPGRHRGCPRGCPEGVAQGWSPRGSPAGVPHMGSSRVVPQVDSLGGFDRGVSPRVSHGRPSIEFTHGPEDSPPGGLPCSVYHECPQGDSQSGSPTGGSQRVIPQGGPPWGYFIYIIVVQN
jgi:hypothetical protein